MLPTPVTTHCKPCQYPSQPPPFHAAAAPGHTRRKLMVPIGSVYPQHVQGHAVAQGYVTGSRESRARAVQRVGHSISGASRDVAHPQRLGGPAAVIAIMAAAAA